MSAQKTSVAHWRGVSVLERSIPKSQEWILMPFLSLVRLLAWVWQWQVVWSEVGVHCWLQLRFSCPESPAANSLHYRQHLLKKKKKKVLMLSRFFFSPYVFFKRLEEIKIFSHSSGYVSVAVFQPKGNARKHLHFELKVSNDWNVDKQSKRDT